MTKKKEKEESRFNLKKRTPKEKPNFFQNVTPFKHPVTELFEQQESMTSHTSQPSDTSMTTLPTQPSHTRQSEPDAKKSFQKIPNSVSKKAIPEGLFKPGKSKHLYDVLVGLTRADIVPKFSIRMSKTKLRKLAGIGSRVTFDGCVEHLESVGLIKVDIRSGEHEGNVFEVFFPEEITLTSQSSVPSHTRQPSPAQNVDTLDSLESSQTSQTSEPINTGILDAPKTLFKTNTNDDEAFSKFREIFQNLSRKFHGRELKDLPEIAKVLAAELERIDKITPITNIDKFAAEHLRRTFARDAARKPEIKKDTVGKSDYVETEIKKLSAEERQNALAELADFKGNELESFAKWYTTDDWQWIKENLK